MSRSLVEGTKYFIRTFWISSIAITVLTLSIGLIAIAFSTRQLTNTIIRQFDKKATVLVLIADTATDYDLRDIQNNLKGIDGVSNVAFSSKADEKKRIEATNQSTSDYNQVFDQLGFNPFLNSYIVTPKNAETYRQVVSSIDNTNFKMANKVQKVVAKQEFIDKLTQAYNLTNIIGWAFVIIFGFISVIVIVNILRISISYFQTEIEIQRLVGATNRYIQGPFIFQGFLFALVATIIVAIVQITLFLTIIPNLGKWFGITDTTPVRNELFLSLALVLLLAILVSTVAAWYSTKRYLKK